MHLILTTLKPLCGSQQLCVAHNKLWKILKETRIWDHLTSLLRKLYTSREATVRTEHGTTDWFQIGKGVYCHPVYLTSIQSASCEMSGWIELQKLNQDWWEEYQQPQICRWYHSKGRKWRGTQEPLDKGERGEWKSWLKSQHLKY